MQTWRRRWDGGHKQTTIKELRKGAQDAKIELEAGRQAR